MAPPSPMERIAMRHVRRWLAAITIALVATLVAQPAFAADPAGPGCKKVLGVVINCNAENWYQNVRGIAMEYDYTNLSRGIVPAMGPYMTSDNLASLDSAVRYEGSSRAFRLCAR